MKYRSEIDGLRALAVVPVIFFHAGFKTFSGGFVGVDVFFVISGYLITSIIINDLESGDFSIIHFYERRARRILPALFFVILCCLPFAWLWLLPDDMKNFSQSLVSTSVFASNIFFWFKSGYFDRATELKPLIHTWSLSVEEQYYVFFPLIMLATWRFGRRWIATLLIFIALASFSLAQYYSTINPSLDFYLLPTRAWELMIGALVAFYYTEHNIKEHRHFNAELGSFLGLLLIIYSIFTYSSQTPMPSVYALAPTLGAALIIVFSNKRTLVGRVLGSKYFILVGLISYSAYLWHQPIFAFARHRSLFLPDTLLMSSLVLLTMLLAYLSWRFVERPFRNKNVYTRKQIFFIGFIGGVVFIGLGVVGHFTHGFQNRIKRNFDIHDNQMSLINNGWCFYSVDSISELDVGRSGLGCWLGDRNSKRKAILFGDSFAGQYEPFWDVVGNEQGFTLNAITTNWCFPSLNKKFYGVSYGGSNRSLNQCIYNREYFIKNIDHYDFIVVASIWGTVSASGMMDDVMEFIKIAAIKGKPVVIMASPRQYDINPIKSLQKSLLRNEHFDIDSLTAPRDEFEVKANKLLKEESKKINNVLFIDRDSMFNESDLTDEGYPYSFEGTHISIYGSKRAAEKYIKSPEYNDLVRLLNRS